MTSRGDGSVAEPPKPWSPAARDDFDDGLASIEALAGSVATRRLVTKIERYAAGEIAGHAVLVAGHRGAGKTTAVRAAMQTVYNQFQRRATDCRPLLVPLHGPSLLLASKGAPHEDGQPAATSTTTEVTPRTAQRHSHRFLQEMAAGILPALLQELRRMLEERVARGAQRYPEHHRQASVAKGREIIAHIIDELSQGMGLAELRELYRRLELLPDGLLRGDAFEEITAINAAGEAYAVVTGTVGDEKKFDQEQHQKQVSDSKFVLTGETLTKSLSTVGAAAAAVVGLANDSPIAAVASAAVMLLGGVSLTSSSQRESNTKAKRERTFKQDNSLESLVRRVPLLVDQLRAVGLPPVFVVDELDKIEDPPVYDLLDGLMRNLKSYVTERSLILFIADRDYYHRITRAPSQTHERYGVEHTFFGGRVYVVSSAPDLHQFLRRTLAEDQPASESDLPAHRRAEQRRAFALIRHALLHRGRMHPYDVGRQLELSYDSGERDRLEANPGLLLRNRSTRYEALFQLCIEWVLAEGSQQREGSSDPYYVQIAYDALYQVSDRWKDGQSLRDPPAIEAAWIQQRTSEPHQRTLLRGALDQLMHYLAEPSRLTAEVTDELDGTRLTLFLREGEADPETGDVDAIIDELGDDQLRGRNPRLVAAALATAKFDLLRALADTLDPVFGPDSYAPLIDPRGYGRVDPLISEEEQRRIDRLQAIRQFDQVTAVGFDALWGLASRGGTIDVLDAALAPNTPLVPGDGRASNRDVLRQFAAEAPEAERIVFAALVCVHVMAAITETEPCTDHVQTLGRIVRGVGAHARFEFVATLATKLLRLHGATPSAQTRRLLTWERGTLPLPNAEDLEAALDIPDLARDLGTARAEWELSICERMLIRLAQRQLDAEVNREGQFLDLVAGLHHWFPRALEVWRQFPEPSQWTIKIWSDVLDDPDTMTVVRGFAALQLGMVSRLRDLLASDQTESSPSQWLQRRLDELGKEPRPVVILVNPGVVMSEWNPVPGLSVRVLEVEALDETTVPDIRHAAAVFHEYGTPVKQQGKGNRQAVRPESLQPSQYAIVRPGTADGRWDTLADGTPILHAPPSLRAALELHRRVFPR